MSNQKFLICDCVGTSEIQILTNESSGSQGGPVRFKGKFQEAGVKNKNNRMYQYDILEREKCRLEPIISERRLFGELDHPQDSVIHLENASHVITKLWWENSKLMGEGEILPTPAGKILETIIRCGIPVGISSRGVGTGKANNEGIMMIDPNFRLITFDVVADPSTPHAFIGEKKNNNFYKETITKTNNENFSQKTGSSSVNSNNNINADIAIAYMKEYFKKSLNNI